MATFSSFQCIGLANILLKYILILFILGVISGIVSKVLFFNYLWIREIKAFFVFNLLP